jgi:lipid-binding SYLF domain-containing protein
MRRGKIFFAAVLLALLLSEAHADSVNELENHARAALSKLYQHNQEAVSIQRRAVGVLVFPEVRDMGIGLGLQTATGVLLRNLKAADYFNLTGVSLGLELGVQKFSYVIFFMNENALNDLYNSANFDFGIKSGLVVGDGICSAGVSSAAQNPGICVFRFNRNGGMAKLGLQWSKITGYSPGD